VSSEIDALRERAQQWIEDFEGAAVRPGETFLIIRDLLAAVEAQQGVIDRNECSLCDTSRLSTYDKAAIQAFNERAEARKR
jgi:hypothetical protein